MVLLPYLLAGFVISVSTIPMPNGMPEPGELAFVLSEDDFEDYLDKWLEIEESNRKWGNHTRSGFPRSGGCSLRVNGDLGQPQPVYLKDDDYVVPTGNTGIINLDQGEKVIIACTGSGRRIVHPQVSETVATATATCVGDSLVSGDGWMDGNGEFVNLLCSSNAYHDAEGTAARCYNNNLVIRIGFIVEGEFYPLYYSCFDQNRLEVLYVRYEQNPPNAVHQSNVNRPSWLVGSFYPGVSVAVNTMYTQVTQKATIAELVGQELADKYVTSTQFLARGHLAAKTDFIYATGQRATFYFINAAPQWQPFNAGNWNYLEQNLRARIGDANYHTVIYTGTFGVSQLRNETGHLVDIYLHKDANNNNQLPVPLYYYKVVYDESLKLGTAYVSINNPYYTEEEVRELTFCTDVCRREGSFAWLRWEPDRIDTGYSFCCEVDDFRRTIPHLPYFEVNGILD